LRAEVTSRKPSSLTPANEALQKPKQWDSSILSNESVPDHPTFGKLMTSLKPLFAKISGEANFAICLLSFFPKDSKKQFLLMMVSIHILEAAYRHSANAY